jgi:hypothetical protein
MKGIKTKLQNIVLETYWRDPEYHKANHEDKRQPIHKAWDVTQKKYKVLLHKCIIFIYLFII